VATTDGSFTAEVAKKDRAPLFERIPSETADRFSRHHILPDNMVAMRYGARLATDVYLPDGNGPFPTILTRMPYGKTEPYCFMPLIAQFFTSKGYASVVQDVRSKWGS
jgi:predicted acyl esterase